MWATSSYRNPPILAQTYFPFPHIPHRETEREVSPVKRPLYSVDSLSQWPIRLMLVPALILAVVFIPMSQNLHLNFAIYALFRMLFGSSAVRFTPAFDNTV